MQSDALLLVRSQNSDGTPPARFFFLADAAIGEVLSRVSRSPSSRIFLVTCRFTVTTWREALGNVVRYIRHENGAARFDKEHKI